jgi:hypothetical protein
MLFAHGIFSGQAHADEHPDTGPLDPLIFETWVRVPVRERHISSTDFNLNTITTT